MVGLETGVGTDLHVDSSWIEGSDFHGVFAQGGYLGLFNTHVNGSGNNGIWAVGAAVIEIGNGSIQNSTYGAMNADGGVNVSLWSTLIKGNGSGIGVWHGSTLGLSGADEEPTVIEDTLYGGGVWIGVGSSLAIDGDVVIRGNKKDGISLSDTGVATWRGNVQVYNNEGWGIYCEPDPAVAQVGSGSDPIRELINGSGMSNCPGMPPYLPY